MCVCVCACTSCVYVSLSALSMYVLRACKHIHIIIAQQLCVNRQPDNLVWQIMLEYLAPILCLVLRGRRAHLF